YVKDNNKVLSGIEAKYKFVEKKDIQFCDKEENTALISKEKKFNIVSYQEGNNYYYYKARKNECELIGEIENVNFTENIESTYANDSIYTSFESLSDFEISGMVRVSKDEIHPFDSLSVRYSNPVAFSEGVIMLENHRNVIAFDKNNKKIFTQNNETNGRNVLALNLVDRSLFMIVEINGKYLLEAYDINNQTRIKKINPNLEYDVTNYFKNFDYEINEITTQHSNYYGSFTFNGKTLVISDDFSKLFVFNNADTALGLDESYIYLKKDELYYVVDLSAKTREHIGNIKALGFKNIGDSLYFTVLDNDGTEVYIQFTIK
ncbi:hypothetical protein LJB88_01225, partial [Erysipelotrichaceae bacterium OttesenSCG-928-M19]|nr:hypothetical protein [Erysipelotrichaceae bacterium OttesenSCG-928-M19]